MDPRDVDTDNSRRVTATARLTRVDPATGWRTTPPRARVGRRLALVGPISKGFPACEENWIPGSFSFRSGVQPHGRYWPEGSHSCLDPAIHGKKLPESYPDNCHGMG